MIHGQTHRLNHPTLSHLLKHTHIHRRREWVYQAGTQRALLYECQQTPLPFILEVNLPYHIPFSHTQAHMPSIMKSVCLSAFISLIAAELNLMVLVFFLCTDDKSWCTYSNFTLWMWITVDVTESTVDQTTHIHTSHTYVESWPSQCLSSLSSINA